MKVTEALKITQRAPREQPRFECYLACGFTPLHLQLFLTAELQIRLPQRYVQTATGLYGGFADGLENLAGSESHAVACAIEWPDLDPRFSYREAGGWCLAAIPDIVEGARAMLDRIRLAIERVPEAVRVAVSLPTLPFPPVFQTVGSQASAAELLIEEYVAHFAAGLAERRGTVVVNERRLNEESAPSARLDLKSDLATGLPYTLQHASALAQTFARLLTPDAPKKGIITDLDDTLWHGLVGELGPEGVAWDLANHAQLHGLYQKLLSSLADAGVLIAIASKNDASVVEKTLRRGDLLVKPSQMFPVEVHWQPKSGSVDRILRTWNIGADSVIFVDDSPMELAEVAAAHPGITALRFPTGQPQAALELLRSLRDLCGKEWVSKDDALRLESIRRGAEFARDSAAVASPEDFLRSASATLTVDFHADTNDVRALELVNKTNQFNINGVRYTEFDWKKNLMRPGAVLLVVSYTDKFGPLGKIGVVQGRVDGNVLWIQTWVLSCRAFARRIEYQFLRLLFDKYNVQEVMVEFMPTVKNGPARDFFGSLCGFHPDGPFRLGRAQVEEKCPPLYHQISEMERVETNG